MFTPLFIDQSKVRFVEMKITSEVLIGRDSFKTTIHTDLFRAEKIDWH
jgi:hypothetical protein